MKTKYHKHHIIPRHAGGTNDSSNIRELTVEEHAEAHKVLWEEHKNYFDFLAWKALSGQIKMSEASNLAWIAGSYKGGYASKPNKVPAWNKTELYCVGCHKKIKPSDKGHKICFRKKYNLELRPNQKNKFSKGDFRCIEIAKKNNSLTNCPHCGKSGQYRAMKRWHFDNCKFR